MQIKSAIFWKKDSKINQKFVYVKKKHYFCTQIGVLCLYGYDILFWRQFAGCG